MALAVDRSLPSKEDLAQIKTKLKSSTGKRILRSLFIETVTQSAAEGGFVDSVFTLKDHNFVKNGKSYWSLKNLYLSYDHIPGLEYEFATDVFGDWDHWVMLADSDIIGDHISSWREQMTVKLQAKALKAMMKTALYEGAKGTPAAKFIADRGWEVKRGRPSKEEVEKERKIQAGVSQELADDMARLGLSVVKGGK